jgi:hypothetical protein
MTQNRLVGCEVVLGVICHACSFSPGNGLGQRCLTSAAISSLISEVVLLSTRHRKLSDAFNTPFCRFYFFKGYGVPSRWVYPMWSAIISMSE